ncbi:hypothetical protein GOV06_01750 [Candidatus Woesearchaeota archaeon]|nr:hypothetical protein [Candidatus Woesearchaeota archaeon]
MGDTKFSETGESLGLTFCVERIIHQLKGRDPDYVRREEVLEAGIQYFENAKMGFISLKEEMFGENYEEELAAFNHVMEVDPNVSGPEPVAFFSKLDEFATILKQLKYGKDVKEGNAQILGSPGYAETVKKELLGFYDKLVKYESLRRHQLKHSR